MRFGVQFRGNVPASSTRRWFTHSWPEGLRVAWMIVPTWPLRDRAPQLEWKVQTERQAAGLVKYYIEVRNLTAERVDLEARFAVLNQ